MNDTVNMLFALLRSVICAEELNKEKFVSLDERELESLYKISKNHDMSHLVGVALNKAGLLKGKQIAEKFGKQQMLAVYRYERSKYEFDAICDVFDNAKIRFIPLKGAVIRELYPEPWMRTSCDIDILVHKSDLDRAVDLIKENLGYEVKEKDEIHDVSLYSESGVHLELHFSINEGMEIVDQVLSQVWDYASNCDAEHQRYDLKNEFLVFYAVSHMLEHFIIGGCGIRTVCDLYLLRNKMGYDEDQVLELCRIAEIEDFYLALKNLSDVWFSNEDHDDLTARMESYILVGGVYGTTESRIAIKQGAAGGKMRYAGSRIFAPYDRLRERYPSLKSRALVPIYQVRRWIDTVREKRVGRSVQELKVNENLDREKVDGIKLLISDLKLNNHIK